MKVAVIQFVKGRSDTGEEGFYQRVAGLIPGSVSWHVSGEGFTWENVEPYAAELRRAAGA